MLPFVPRSASARVRALLSGCLAAVAIGTPLLAASQHRHHVAPPARALHQDPAAVEEWIGLYFGRQKVGYSVTRTTPTTYHARPALQENGHTVTHLVVLGAQVEEDEVSESVTDLKHRPLKQTLDVKSNGSVLHLDALFDYDASKVFCTVGTGASATRKTLDIPPGANLTTDPNSLTDGQSLSVGKKLTFYYLQPLSVKLMPATLEVTNRATVRSDAGKQVSTFEVHADLPEGKMVGWAGANGSVVKSELRLGPIVMTMVTESRLHALDTAYLSPALEPAVAGAPAVPTDFADATALTPDKPLDDPRKLRYLKVAISGVPEQNLIPSDTRQTCTREHEEASTSDGATAEFTVRADQFGAADASRLPLNDASLAPYLARAAYLEVDDVPIRETALRLRGKQTNLYLIASKIRDWVHGAMTPDPSIGVVRSAKDVFERRRGVCRDYATLYAALARAAGVPTRLCAGIVYADGKFFYHAWAESYVGRWVAFDPTLYDAKQADYVDATHIKFAQGDVTQMFEVVGIVGRLKIHILDSGAVARAEVDRPSSGHTN
jgi:transglutaminase-like putative cysteine protease